MKEYDYLIVGAGLYGAVMAHELKKKGKKCLVIDRRDHIAGNIYCEDIEGIHVHYEGTCSVVDNQEETIEITSIVCDPLIYKSRQDIPQKCPESAKKSICDDIRTQLRALNIANYESIPISISIICEE